MNADDRRMYLTDHERDVLAADDDARLAHRRAKRKAKARRKKCPIDCTCLCHDMGGGTMHPNAPCPGKEVD